MTATTTVAESVEFGANVRHYRDERGWTRPQLAQRLRTVDPLGGWKTSKITNIERGAVRHPTLRTIRLLAIVFGCTTDDLVMTDPSSRTAWFGDSLPDLLELSAA